MAGKAITIAAADRMSAGESVDRKSFRIRSI
jgi:hypothetical protein